MRSYKSYVYNSGREVVSAETYLELIKNPNVKILESHIIPPNLGSNDFGKFSVKLRRKVIENTEDIHGQQSATK